MVRRRPEPERSTIYPHSSLPSVVSFSHEREVGFLYQNSPCSAISNPNSDISTPDSAISFLSLQSWPSFETVPIVPFQIKDLFSDLRPLSISSMLFPYPSLP